MLYIRDMSNITSAPEFDRMRAQLRGIADRQNAQWPQYRGHWDGPEWIVVQIHQRVSTKLGVAFERGDYAIAKKGEFGWVAYSDRNAIDTHIAASAAFPATLATRSYTR